MGKYAQLLTIVKAIQMFRIRNTNLIVVLQEQLCVEYPVAEEVSGAVWRSLLMTGATLGLIATILSVTSWWNLDGIVRLEYVLSKKLSRTYVLREHSRKKCEQIFITYAQCYNISHGHQNDSIQTERLLRLYEMQN